MYTQLHNQRKKNQLRLFTYNKIRTVIKIILFLVIAFPASIVSFTESPILILPVLIVIFAIAEGISIIQDNMADFNLPDGINAEKLNQPNSDTKPLFDAVSQMCIASNLPRNRINVYIMPNKLPNAFSFGNLHRRRSGIYTGYSDIVITSGLLALSTPEELQAVVAHEFWNILTYFTRFEAKAYTSLTDLSRKANYIIARDDGITGEAYPLVDPLFNMPPNASELTKYGDPLQPDLSDAPMDDGDPDDDPLAGLSDLDDPTYDSDSDVGGDSSSSIDGLGLNDQNDVTDPSQDNTVCDFYNTKRDQDKIYYYNCFYADLGAVYLTRDPKPLVSILWKIQGILDPTTKIPMPIALKGQMFVDPGSNNPDGSDTRFSQPSLNNRIQYIMNIK